MGEFLAARLDKAIKAAGIPITGVAIGNPATDKAQWLVRPSNLQSAAQPTIDAFDENDPAIVSAEKDALAAQLDTNAAIQAVAQLDFEERQKLQVKAGQTLRTAQQCKDRAREIYKSLLP